MGFWDQMGIGLRSLAIVCAVISALWLVKVTVFGGAILIERLLLPVERKALQWLQDRATARTLGLDITVIRVRRKSQFPKVTDRAE